MIKVANFISHFTPSLMPPTTLEALFVQREPLAQHLVDAIRESALTQNRHHSLLIGPRGIGKTHLVALVYHRIKAMPDLHDRLRIAWLREEEWGVSSLLDLLLRIFRALQAETPHEFPSDRVAALYDLKPAEAERAAAELLHEVIGDRTLLLLIENLDDLFAGLEDKGQRKLRAYIQETALFTILATSQSLFNGVSSHTAPFYGFFDVEHLTEFSLEDAIDLLANIAEFRGDADLAEFIRTPTGRARIRAVRHLAGGNPRVYVIFSQFLTRDSLDELVGPFMKMLDELTPYYQARLTYLSNQQRKIIEYLCDRRGAVPVKEIAQHNFITPQTASSQLKDLRDKGYVISDPLGPTGRESYYELREPLMRMCIEVKKNRGEPISLFVDFLRLWYPASELRNLLAKPTELGELERNYLAHALTLAEQEVVDPRVAACLKDFQFYISGKDYARAIKAVEELISIRDEVEDKLAWIFCLIGLSRWQEALTASTHVKDAAGTASGRTRVALRMLQAIAHLELEHYELALDTIDLTTPMDSELPDELKRTRQKIGGLALAGLGHFTAASLVLHDQGANIENTGDISTSLLRIQADRGRILQGFAHNLDQMNHDLADSTSIEHPLQELFQLLPTLPDHDLSAEVSRSFIKGLASLFFSRGRLSLMAKAFGKAIPTMVLQVAGSMQSSRLQEIWQETVGNHDEFKVPLRLLDVAIRYGETHDKRVLLELPSEERAVLEMWLAQDEREDAEGVLLNEVQ